MYISLWQSGQNKVFLFLVYHSYVNNTHSHQGLYQEDKFR